MANLLEYLDPHQRDQAVTAITNAVGKTLDDDGKTDPKQSEIKERFEKALGLVQVMRNDLGWSWRRIDDNLAVALREKLDNGDWTPPTRSTWSTDTSSGLILPPGVK